MTSEDRTASKEPAGQEGHERGPGRPSAVAGPVVSRDELLRIAARLIGRSGFAATSIRGLASEAGVSHGTVQHHFPTKDNLWKALVDEVIVPDLNEIRDRLLAGAYDGFEDLLAGRLRQAMSRPGLSGAVLADHTAGAADRIDYLASATRPIREQSITQTQALIDGGLVRNIDLDSFRALVLILSYLSSSDLVLRAFYDIDINNEEKREQLIVGIVDIVLHGLLPRE